MNIRYSLICDLSGELYAIAEEKREEAGFNGAKHDGGASAIEHTVDTFRSGVMLGMRLSKGDAVDETMLPDIYQKRIVQRDARYEQYLKLKKEFEGKSVDI